MKKSFHIGKTYIKTIQREIKGSFGRFFAIFAIVALGVGFLAGLLATTPDMKVSVDKYYDNNHMTDIFIKGTMGLTQSDLKAVKTMSEVERLMPACVTDALVKTSNNEVLETRIYGISLMKNNNSSVNSIELIKGRMPKQKNECLVEQSGSYLTKLKLGTTMTLSKDNEDYKNIGDTYNTLKYTVVGIVKNPFYISTEREPSNIGKGSLGAILYVDESCYALDVYTDFYITVKGASDLTAFTDEYKSYIDPVVKKLKTKGTMQSKIRHNEIVEKAEDKLNKSKIEYEDGKGQAEEKLSEAFKKLENGKVKIAESVKTLTNAEKLLLEGKTELNKERGEYEKKILENESKLRTGEIQVKAAKQTLVEKKSMIDAAKNDIEQAKTALANGVVLTEEVMAKITQYDEGVKAYDNGMAQITEKETVLQNNRTLLENSIKKAEEKFSNAEAKLEKLKIELTIGKAKLEKAKNELLAGQTKYEEGKAKSTKELKSAASKISDAEKKVAEIEIPKWYVLDRSSNMSYASFKINAEKVADIATVFPIFFFLVAALVALTTMTRMVEEERIQIGTLKALGYTKGAIMAKYLVYCGLASVLGCIFGMVTGFRLIPTIAFTAYASMFHMPPLITQFNWPFGITACVLIIFCTMSATISACNQSLKEKPAFLMLPRAPKAGKRILLERFKFIWSHMKFSHKATARNLFRYKKHFFMTVIGIAGCTALILTGFGLKDSITSIAGTQYEEILKYDLRIDLNKADNFDTLLNNFLKDKSLVEQYTELHSEAGYASNKKERVSTVIYVPKNVEQIKNYINLRERESAKEIVFNTTSVILTEKMAAVIGVKAGDSFILENADGKTAEFVVTAITENYVGCYVYVNPAAYSKAFGGANKLNTLFVNTITRETASRDKIISKVLASNTVSNAEYISQMKNTFSKLVSSMGYVIIFLILAAGALAMIVLYNLTNININERSKELATLRVLGYHHEEVATYIFREITILSLIGTGVGLLLGVALHTFIIGIAESLDMMFGRSISITSFLMSAAITMIFSVAVDLLMLRKLRKIEMVESMKAVD